MTQSPLKKTWLSYVRYFFIGLAILIFLIVLFAGPIAKVVVEHYDEEWTGRHIEMDRLKINLLSGVFGVKGFKIFEKDSEDIFFQVEDMFANLTLYKLIAQKLEITEVAIVKPYLQVIQQDSTFNFDDLVERFSSDSDSTARESEPEEEEEPMPFKVSNIHLDEGRIVYQDLVLPSEIAISSLNVKTPVVDSENPETQCDMGFRFDSGGQVDSGIQVDIDSLDYQVQLKVEQFNIGLLLPYLTEYLRINDFQGSFSTAIALSGNGNQQEDINSSGEFILENFKLIDEQDRTVVGFDRFFMGIDTLETANERYAFGQIKLDAPSLIVVQFADTSNNLTGMMRESETTGEPSDTATVAEADAATDSSSVAEYPNISVKSIQLENGRVEFSDFTLIEDFQSIISDLNIRSSEFDMANDRATIEMGCVINEAGVFSGVLNINPRDLMEVDARYTLESLPLSGFNPYSKHYVAYPFFQGGIFYEGTILVQNRQLESDNKIMIRTIEVGDKVVAPEAADLPIPLAVSLLTDSEGNIEINLPIKGDLDDPGFNAGEMVVNFLSNLILEVTTSPFKLLANVFDVNETEIQQLAFNYTQSNLEESQQASLNQVAKVIGGKEKFVLEYYPLNNMDIEKKALALQKCAELYYRKQFVTEDRPLNDQDSVALLEITLQDSLFQQFLSPGDSPGQVDSLSPQQRCVTMLDQSQLDAELMTIRQRRDSVFLQYMTQEKKIAPERIRLWQSDSLQTRDTTLLERPLYLFNFNLAGTEPAKPTF